MTSEPRRVLLIGSSSKWRIAALQRFFQDDSTTHERRHLPKFNEFLTLSPDIDEKAIRRETAEELCVAIAQAKMEKIISVLTSGQHNRIWQPVATSNAVTVSSCLSPADNGCIQEEEEPRSPNLCRIQELFSLVSNPYTSSTRTVDDFWILTGDQVAVHRGTIREKPESREENVAFLQSYRGNYVETVAGTVLVRVHPSYRGNKGTEEEGEPQSHFLRSSTVNHTKTSFRADLPDEVILRVVNRGDSMICCGGFVVEDVDLKEYISDVEPSLEAVTGLDVEAVGNLMQSMMTTKIF
jgi:predicted house-cleaning NTP pyrophosphatase (Maf/HAM1 superfamily)